MNKYRNIKYHGFDSRKEARRYEELRMLEKAGKITDLKKQVKFQLVPHQKGADGKVIERAVNYIADFTYVQDGKYVVEDTKGYKLPEYIIKRKLMLYIHGIRIKEV